MELIVGLRGLNSDQRRKFFKKNIDTLSSEVRDQIVSVATDLACGELTDSDRLKRDAVAIAERLQPGVTTKTEKPSFATELLDALSETDLFRPHMEVFSRYLNSQADESNRILSAHARYLFTAPEEILKHVKVASIIEDAVESDPSVQTGEIATFGVFNLRLREALESLTPRPESAQLDRAKLVNWMRLLCSDSEYGSVADRLLYRWLNVVDFATAIDHIHQLATAAYTSDEAELQRKMMTITGLSSSIMPIDSPAAIRYMAAMTPAFPEEWRKRREIDDAEKSLISRRAFYGRLQMARQLRTRACREYLRSLDAKSVIARRGESIDGFIDAAFRELGVGAWRRMWPQRTTAVLDDDPIMRDSPLRSWITDRVTNRFPTRRLSGRKRILSGAIKLPGLLRSIKAPVAQVASEVSRAITEVPTCELESPEHWRTLALLVPPDLSQTRLDDLSRTNSTMVAEILGGRLRGFSQRGDKIFITSPLLLQLGFNKLEIRYLQEGYQVRLDVHGKSFKGQLDQNFQLVNTESGALLRLPITGTFLRHVIVCHINELLCSQWEDNESDGTSEATRQFYSRRDHQRVLPLGERPTRGQIVKALYDYGIDLVARNRQRLESGEIRYVTWVSEVDRIDMHGVGPVESYATRATEQLDKILASKGA